MYLFELELCRIVELCISNNRINQSNFDDFWRENEVTWIDSKIKISTNDVKNKQFLKSTMRQNQFLKFFWKAQLVKELLSFNSWISRHFVTILRNISTFQNAIYAKAIDLLKELYRIFLSRRAF